MKEENIVFEIKDFGYVFNVERNIFDVRINGNDYAVSAGQKNNADDAIKLLKRLSLYPENTRKFLNVKYKV